MRKPFNRLTAYHASLGSDCESMLNRSFRLRYDPPVCADLMAEVGSFGLDAEEDDMEITGAGAVGGPGAVRPTQLSGTQQAESLSSGGIQSPCDEVAISSTAQALGELDQAGQLHQARLEEIRAAIADGTYETPAKLEAALERMLKSIDLNG